MTTILTERGEFTVAATNGLWLTGGEAARVTGWTLKPEGMCRDGQCVPMPPMALRDGRVDVEAFWRRLGHPACVPTIDRHGCSGPGPGSATPRSRD